MPAEDDVRTVEPGPSQAAVGKAAAGRDLNPQEQQDATAWFLADDHSEEPASRDIELNVGSGNDPATGKPRETWISWTVMAIDRDRIRQIRKQSQDRVRAGAAAEMDEMKANLRCATEGTAIPAINTDPAFLKMPDGGTFADPADRSCPCRASTTRTFERRGPQKTNRGRG
jgi:hypothetical protein